MTTFTFHVEAPFAESLRNAAKSAGVSINTFIKEKLGSALGLSKRADPDFLNFAGCMSKDCADELRSVQHDFDAIDEDVWK